MTDAGAAPAAKTNTLAIVGLILSIIGCYIIGIILGLVAKNQIKRTGEAGDGIATAAIVVGLAWLALNAVIALITWL
jgi:peptidyl-prolyl cis-trans isomerase B (cyclophilin B)